MKDELVQRTLRPIIHPSAFIIHPFRVGPEGFEPPPRELKARCAAVTPRPRIRSRYLFMSLSLEHDLISVE